MSKAILIDLTRCIGCRACQGSCKEWHELPAEETSNQGSYENPPRRSAKTWTTVTFNETITDNEFKWVFAKRQCMHCEDPACASACIVGALHKTDDGPVVYDDYKCIGCRYCTLACPFSVPTFEWDKPIPYIRKCTMCVDRQTLGMEPACTKVCPTDALLFGNRDALFQDAHARIQAEPDKYVNHIYGEFEVGGTSQMYLSGVPFEELGFPTLGTEPIPRYANVAMSAVPPTVVGATALMAGLYWIINRREQNMHLAIEQTEKEDIHDES